MIETSERVVIRQLGDQRYATIVRGDYDAFRELCHADLAYTHSTGITDCLDSYLAKCTQGFYDHHRIDHPIRDISIFGDVALALGEMRADLTAGGVLHTARPRQPRCVGARRRGQRPHRHTGRLSGRGRAGSRSNHRRLLSVRADQRCLRSGRRGVSRQ